MMHAPTAAAMPRAIAHELPRNAHIVSGIAGDPWRRYASLRDSVWRWRSAVFSTLDQRPVL